ncbi:TOM13-domain-containing protein [Eremomyces bilateralis CBS 781.70]|uniref:TOM13-domain-containing protein n=1 Tax=Eremomyces bilateralis CBS 781.70 TaxID=1392243 RepID=A0A6G1G2U0_9PEZI|nr:TOM13-domain-containing protein [Eremomyces bilateralis CBS 781.70]KAF1812374.1 TOM13-domain-containing protein [Eremomyces bilateralis CBS 781.70]
MANLADSAVTIPSDSEIYDANHPNDPSFDPSPHSESPSHRNDDTPMILYHPPTMWGLIRGATINLFLPFVNGLMLGFGELFAHEIAFRLGWSRTKVFPSRRSDTRRAGPGVEVRESPDERRRRSGREMDMYTSLE